MLSFEKSLLKQFSGVMKGQKVLVNYKKAASHKTKLVANG